MGILAYNPLIHLVNSHVAIYKIYVLKNPFTEDIFYVGQTLQELETRLSGHYNDKESNKKKAEYIQGIISQGGNVIIEAVETIKGTCYVDKMALNERERYWMRYYKALGCDLLNILGARENSDYKAYQNYLTCIKRGEASWHYYYCGETIRGEKVYDEDRLKADGFSFPKDTLPSISNEFCEEGEYNPWNNERFIVKIGYRNKIDDYSYVPCYKDTDPNYYDDDY